MRVLKYIHANPYRHIYRLVIDSCYNWKNSFYFRKQNELVLFILKLTLYRYYMNTCANELIRFNNNYFVAKNLLGIEKLKFTKINTAL